MTTQTVSRPSSKTGNEPYTPRTKKKLEPHIVIRTAPESVDPGDFIAVNTRFKNIRDLETGDIVKEVEQVESIYLDSRPIHGRPDWIVNVKGSTVPQVWSYAGTIPVAVPKKGIDDFLNDAGPIFDLDVVLD